MKSKIRYSIQSLYEWANDLRIQHALPNSFTRAIGPFVLMDHISSHTQYSNEPGKEIIGECPIARRGVATLTYIITGEVEHVDSIGNHVKLSSGSVHWMKAGKGVVHEEAVNPGCRINNQDISVARFWINLPSRNKCDDPEYLSLQPGDIPKQMLADDAGWIKILCGTYNNEESKIPLYSGQFLYHFHLAEKKNISIATDGALEYAAFLLTNKAIVCDTEFQAGAFIAFNSSGELIEIYNPGISGMDMLLFGGEPCNEPIVIDGSFVMNNPHEITQAYNDYYDGKYGIISHDQLKDK